MEKAALESMLILEDGVPQTAFIIVYVAVHCKRRKDIVETETSVVRPSFLFVDLVPAECRPRR